MDEVVELQEKKRQASADVVHTSVEGIDSFSADDIRYILQLGRCSGVTETTSPAVDG